MPTQNSMGDDIRINAEFMFSNDKNIYKAGLERKQRKLLKKISFINPFLESDEEVLLVTPCVSPTSLWEQLTTGWIYMYINRALLIVTNKGIFHIPTKSNYDYRQSIARFRYEDCKALRVRGSYLYVQYGNGKKERFLYVPGAQRRKLKTYFGSLQTGTGMIPGNAGKVHICPRCTRPLSPDVYQCNACRLVFKDMATANKLSILIPGGGYFYTEHLFLGLGDFIVELWLLIAVLVSVIGLIDGDSDAAAGLYVFGFLLVLEKLITIHHAKRYVSEYIPKEKSIRVRPMAAEQAG